MDFTTLISDVSNLITAPELLAKAFWIATFAASAFAASTALDWLLARPAAGKGRQLHWITRRAPLIRLAIWALAGAGVAFILFSASVPVLLVLSIPLVIGMGFASQDIIRNVLAGVILAVDRDFQVGDVIRVGEHEGEVRSVGIRHTELLTSAGHLVDVPNVHFLTLPTSNITPDTSDAQVNIRLSLPSTLDVEQAKKLAFTAAAVTRFASLHRAPEVFVEVSLVDKSASLMIRGFVFDPAFETHYRSDVLTIIQRELAAR